jgi:hypothetical protein
MLLLALILALISNVVITTYIQINYQQQEAGTLNWFIFYGLIGVATYAFWYTVLRMFS